jgi:hypothetical protein
MDILQTGYQPGKEKGDIFGGLLGKVSVMHLAQLICNSQDNAKLL